MLTNSIASNILSKRLSSPLNLYIDADTSTTNNSLEDIQHIFNVKFLLNKSKIPFNQFLTWAACVGYGGLF